MKIWQDKQNWSQQLGNYDFSAIDAIKHFSEVSIIVPAKSNLPHSELMNYEWIESWMKSHLNEVKMTYLFIVSRTLANGFLKPFDRIQLKITKIYLRKENPN